MRDEGEKRKRSAEIMRGIRKRRAGKGASGFRTGKTDDGLFEQVKVKMVMRIYGVSSERAKEIVAERMAERAALEAEDKAKRGKRARNSRRRARGEDDERIPVEDLLGMEVGEFDD